MPVARVKHRKNWLFAVTSIVPILGVGAGVYFSQRHVRAAMDQAGLSRAELRKSWSFSVTGNPILVDANGDGEVDIIGYTRYVHDNDRHHIAAFNSISGEILWESSTIWNHSDANSGVLAIHGDVLLKSDDIGTLSAFSKSNGAQKWTLSLGEELDTLCATSPSLLALQLSDEKWKHLNLSEGSMTDLGGHPDECSAIKEMKKKSQSSLGRGGK